MSPATKVYLAGSWSRKHELRDYRDVIEALGFAVTSEWLDEEDGPHGVFVLDQADTKRSYAVRDTENIDAAEIFVCFTSADPTVPQIGGGRHWESGYAYANGTPIVYVGSREHVFHYLMSATVLPTVNDLYLWLMAYPYTSELEERLANSGTWE